MLQRLVLGLLLAGLLSLPGLAEAQLWSSILTPNKGTDWTAAGVDCTGVICTSGIPSASWALCNNLACNNIAPGGGTTPTAANINSAIQGAQVGGIACSSSLPCVVRIKAGTFSMARSISWGAYPNAKPYVALRGAGPGTGGTQLVFTAIANDCNAFRDGSVVEFCGWQAYEGASYNTNTWTAGFNKGGNTITLTCAPCPAINQLIALDQIDDQTDPGTAEVLVSGGGQNTTFSGGGTQARGCSVQSTCRSQQEFKRVTACAPSCSTGSTFTITPALHAANWRAGQTPQAFWPTNSAGLSNVGIEDLSIDFTAALTPNPNGGINHAIIFSWVRNGWVRNVRSVNNNGGMLVARAHVEIMLSARITVRDSYFYGNRQLDFGGGQCDPQCQRYGVEVTMGSDNLIENNIFQHVLSPLVPGTTHNSVWAYNFTIDQVWTTGGNVGNMFPSAEPHDGGVQFNLFEGNDGSGSYEDAIHGTGTLNTYFRNLWRGRDVPCTGCASVKNNLTMPVTFSAYHRFMNVIGNVLGEGGYHQKYAEYSPDNTNCSRSIYKLTHIDTQCSSATPESVTQATNLTRTTLFRWANYDVVTGDVRFCGGPGNTNWVTPSTNCNQITEVPTHGGKYGQSIPVTELVPNSFYLSAQPTTWWAPNPAWGVPPPSWPPIGPGVSGGNISVGSGAQIGLGGHANKIPARLCFEHLSNDTTGYGGGTSIKVFDAATCYFASTGGGGAPAKPTGLTIVP